MGVINGFDFVVFSLVRRLKNVKGLDPTSVHVLVKGDDLHISQIIELRE